MTTPETLLIFRIAGIACAVPAQSVGSIVMPPEHLTHPPGSARSTPGIFRHAEFTYSVLDLHERFGIDTPRRGNGRLLLQEEGIRHYAFWVDEIVGLVRSEQGTWASLPPYLPGDLFWSGFLYQKEIVLCTELQLLRAMHDATPLHRHFEALQQQREKEEQEPEVAHRAAAAEQSDNKAAGSAPPDNAPARPQRPETSHPPRRDRVSEDSHNTQQKIAKPRTLAATKQAGRPQEKPAALSHPEHPPRPREVKPSLAQRAKTGRPSVEKNTSRPAGTAVRAEAPSSQPVATSIVEANRAGTGRTAGTTASPSPPPAHQPPPSGMPIWPWLLVILLLLSAGYWLWFADPESPQAGRTKDTALPPRSDVQVNRSATQPAQAEPPREITEKPAPMPKPAPVTEPEPAPESTAEAGATPGVAGITRPDGQDEVPLRIERDEEGTISLIIDRQAILASQARHTDPLAELPVEAISSGQKGDIAGEQTEEATSPAGESEEAASSTTETAAVDEPVLQPDADWPSVPATTGLEPCDCTHTVVPGDTLWDIAEHYTGNAFNYPDLARRSGIKNPDLIYPGDRVRIIIR